MSYGTRWIVMAYTPPGEVLKMMVEAGTAKTKGSVLQWLIRGFLGGAILAFAATLAFTATQQTGLGIVGALVFPAGFVMIILLGLELVTGSFALIPLSVLKKKASLASMCNHFFWVIIGHLLGSFCYALLYYAVITQMGTTFDHSMVQFLIKLAEDKTLAYEALGAKGIALVMIKAVLCNWMVALGAVMAMTSKSTAGKIAAMWLPIFTFFAQGFEHAVVNMFVIPAGMLLGAEVNTADWWVWNQVPVFIGNFAGGMLFTGIFLYLSHSGRFGRQTAEAQPKGTSAPSALNARTE